MFRLYGLALLLAISLPASAAPVAALTVLFNPSALAAIAFLPFVRKNKLLVSLLLVVLAALYITRDYALQDYPALNINPVATEQLLASYEGGDTKVYEVSHFTLDEIIDAVRAKELTVFETPLLNSVDYSSINKDLKSQPASGQPALALLGSDFTPMCDATETMTGWMQDDWNELCQKPFYLHTESYLKQLDTNAVIKYSELTWGQMLNGVSFDTSADELLPVEGMSLQELKSKYNLIFVNTDHYSYYLYGMFLNTDLNTHAVALLSDYEYLSSTIDTLSANGKKTLFLLGMQHESSLVYPVKHIIDRLYGGREQGIYVSEVLYSHSPYSELFTAPSYQNQSRILSSVSLKGILDSVGAENVGQFFLRQENEASLLSIKEFVFNNLSDENKSYNEGSAGLHRSISGNSVRYSDLINKDFTSVISKVEEGKYYYADAYDFNSLQASNLIGYLVSKNGGVWLGTHDFRAPKETARALSMMRIKDWIKEENEHRKQAGMSPTEGILDIFPATMFIKYHLLKLVLLPVVFIGGMGNMMLGVMMVASMVSLVTYLALRRSFSDELIKPILSVLGAIVIIQCSTLTMNIPVDLYLPGKEYPAVALCLLALIPVIAWFSLRRSLLALALWTVFYCLPAFIFAASIVSMMISLVIASMADVLLPHLPQKAFYLRAAKKAGFVVPSHAFVSNKLQMRIFMVLKMWRLEYPLIVRSCWADEDNVQSLYGKHESYVVFNKSELMQQLSRAQFKDRGGLIVQQFISDAECYGVCHIPSMTPKGVKVEFSAVHNGVTDSKELIHVPAELLKKSETGILRLLNKLKLYEPVTIEFCINKGQFNLLQVKKLPFSTESQCNHARAIIQGLSLLATETPSDRLGASFAAESVSGCLVGSRVYIKNSEHASKWASALCAVPAMERFLFRLTKRWLQSLEARLAALLKNVEMGPAEKINALILLSRRLVKASIVVNNLLLSSKGKVTSVQHFDEKEYLSQLGVLGMSTLWNSEAATSNGNRYTVASHSLTGTKEKLQVLQRITFSMAISECEILYSCAPRNLPMGEYHYKDILALHYSPTECAYEPSHDVEGECDSMPPNVKHWKESNSDDWSLVNLGEDVSHLPEQFMTKKKWVFVGYNSLSHIVMQARVMGCDIITRTTL